MTEVDERDSAIPALIAGVLDYQQADEEGIMVLVSRQACDEAAARLRELKADAERIDYLEAIIKDGSYVSIINDIAAMCLHCYANFGKGPALRTAIDAQRLPGLAHEEMAMKSVIDRIARK